MKNLNFRVLEVGNYYLTTFKHPLSQKRIKRKFLSKQEVQDYKKEIEHKFRVDKSTNYLEMNIIDLLCYYIKDSPNSSFAKKRSLHLIDFIDTFGDLYLHEVSTSIFKSWLNYIQKENKLKDITMRGLKCEIDFFFSYLVKKEVISESPLKSIYYQVNAPSLKVRNILSEKEIESLLKAIKSYSLGYLYPIVKILAETGAKINEVVELEWNDIDFSKKEVSFKKGKKNQARVISLSNELMQILLGKKKGCTRVFMTYYKEPFTPKKIHLLINEYREKTNCKIKWHPMDLRHSLAVNFLSQGGTLKELQKILGHDNVYDTKRLYGEIVKEKIIDSVTSPF